MYDLITQVWDLDMLAQAIEQPTPQPLPGNAGAKVDKGMGFVWTILRYAALLGVAIIGGKLLFAGSNSTNAGVKAIQGVPYVIGGIILIASAASWVNAFI